MSDIQKLNIRAIEEVMRQLPQEFYGVLEIHFHKGLATLVKTIASKKINTEINVTGYM